MKIKLCPKCGKQNDEDAWNCIDCGATLSLNTLIDADEIETSQGDLVRGRVLFSISQYFHSDYEALLDKVVQDDESIVWGCNIAEKSSSPPFQFGYVILTSHKLLAVYFEADIEYHLKGGILPKRSYVNEGGLYWNQGTKDTDEVKIILVQPPNYGLTSTEQASRKLGTFSLKDLYSIALSGTTLIMKLRHGDGISLDSFALTFYSEAEASEIYMPLRENLSSNT